jgi:hypothetical protein
MNYTLTMLLFIYGFIAFGVALGMVPRKMFTHPVERFVVRLACGVSWPMLFGHLLARKTNDYE